ncbi:LysM peptidoglycan-binding domain-containing protein [Vibrio sp. HN007]|uniref:LysM peptidoglycan-binding domain-containing protein n=1 Tax=Vibrio iocasae TaxID=3098914 RepID=UPI0035D42245
MKSINKSLLVLMLGASTLAVGCSSTDEIEQKEQQLSNQEQQLNEKEQKLTDVEEHLYTKEQLLNEKQQNLSHKSQELDDRESAIAEEEARQEAQRLATYVVEKGDTLTVIAEENNTTVKEIVALNPKFQDKDINTLYVGEKIRLN